MGAGFILGSSKKDVSGREKESGNTPTLSSLCMKEIQGGLNYFLGEMLLRHKTREHETNTSDELWDADWLVLPFHNKPLCPFPLVSNTFLFLFFSSLEEARLLT